MLTEKKRKKKKFHQGNHRRRLMASTTFSWEGEKKKRGRVHHRGCLGPGERGKGEKKKKEKKEIPLFFSKQLTIYCDELEGGGKREERKAKGVI